MGGWLPDPEASPSHPPTDALPEEVPEDTEIQGLLYCNGGFFQLDKPVDLMNERTRAAMQRNDWAQEFGWLNRLDRQVRATVSKSIHEAISSFSEQGLDEWVLDFPLQSALTALHLIMTQDASSLLKDSFRTHSSDSDARSSSARRPSA